MDIRDDYAEGYSHAIETFTADFIELKRRMQALEDLVSARDRVYANSAAAASKK